MSTMGLGQKKNPAIVRAEKQAAALKKPLVMPPSGLDAIPKSGFKGVSVTDTDALRSRLAQQKEKQRQTDAIRQRNIERREEACSLVSDETANEKQRLINRRAMNSGLKLEQAELMEAAQMDEHKRRVDQIVREKEKLAFDLMAGSGDGQTRMASDGGGKDPSQSSGADPTELGMQRRLQGLLHPSVERVLQCECLFVPKAFSPQNQLCKRCHQQVTVKDAKIED
jgi:hypothetical protein